MLYQEIKNKEREFTAMTSYTLQEFQALLPFFQTSLDEVKITLEGKERIKTTKSYKNSPFPSTEDKLFFILSYYKQYTTQTMLAATFRITQPKANQWIHYLSPVLKQALSLAKVAPSRNPESLLSEEVGLYAHDGTERPIQRPLDEEKQKQFYSGKKKGHTVKNNVVANDDCHVLYLTSTAEGKKHDKKLSDEENYSFPEGSSLLQDTGFQGFTPEGVEILQPKKSQKGEL